MTPLPDTEKRRFLAASAFFAAFAPAELDRLAARLVERRYADRQTIFSRGDPGTSMMVVVDGRVRIGVTSAEGREVLLAVIGRGHLFGELALLDQRPRSADATALGDCRVLTLDRRDFLPVLRQSPEGALKLFEIVCGRIRAANDQIEGALLMSVEERLARLLLNLAERGCGGPARVDHVFSQGDLGRLIGASRQEVNRHLRQWVADGLLGQDGRMLVIRNPVALRRTAGLTPSPRKSRGLSGSR